MSAQSVRLTDSIALLHRVDFTDITEEHVPSGFHYEQSNHTYTSTQDRQCYAQTKWWSIT